VTSSTKTQKINKK